MDVDDGYSHAELPESTKGLRACLRCSLIKEFRQFHDTGCENCPFLKMEENTQRINECTTSYFEGTIAMLEPNSSWVAKWQRIATFVPGVYAIDVLGQLIDEALDICDDQRAETRAAVKAAK